MPWPNKERDALIIEKYSAGAKLEDLLREFGIQKAGLYKVLKKNGVSTKKVMHHLTTEQENNIIKRVANGEPVTSIENDFEVDDQTIHRMLERRGIKQNFEKHHLVDKAGAAKALGTGLTVKAVAEKFDVSPKTVSKGVKEYFENQVTDKPVVAPKLEIFNKIENPVVIPPASDSPVVIADEKEENVVTKRPNRAPEVIALYADGKSGDEISEILGIGKPYVYKLLKKNGIATKRTMHTMTLEQEEIAILRNKNGEAILPISKDLGVSNQTIHNMFKRRGIEINQNFAKHHIEDERAAINACKDGSRVPEVAKEFGVSESTVSRLIREARANGEEINILKGTPRTYEINESAFDVLSDEAKYWAGFLWADGCISEPESGSPRLIVGLGEKDIMHLEKLRNFLGSTHPIHWVDAKPTNEFKGGPCVYLSIHTKRICNRLTMLGMTIKRTRSPNAELVASRDFWRGSVDGDGWLGTTDFGTTYKISPTIGLSGQMLILEKFQQFLRSNKLAYPNITPTKSGIWRVQILENYAQCTIESLYSNCTIALDRKNLRAQSIITGDIKRFSPYTEIPAAITFAIEELKLPKQD